MLRTNHSSGVRIDEAIAIGTDTERLPTLEELILDLLEGEFAGVIRSHVRGEVYGGC
ncbi:hypothetical protein [Halobiforma nitratireducens]|uniref:hypothetical protein n=1 Tax=Halobiforma nitratireducens TaxID=130048 RepID=UPI0006778B06|nr:hypothetical protein [Halobiforma nitratireducens]